MEGLLHDPVQQTVPEYVQYPLGRAAFTIWIGDLTQARLEIRRIQHLQRLGYVLPIGLAVDYARRLQTPPLTVSDVERTLLEAWNLGQTTGRISNHGIDVRDT